jgi:hypothetical protein
MTNGPARSGFRYTVKHPENPQDGHRPVALFKAPFPDVDAVVEQANSRLTDANSGWVLNHDRDASHSRVVPIELNYDGNPVGRPVADSSGVVRLLVELAAGRTPILDPALTGTPAYKPGALTRGDFGRVPVAVLAGGPPHRRSGADLDSRRPVVALLDTAVDAHPWLGQPDKALGGEGFWVDARTLSASKWIPGDRLKPSQPFAPDPRELGAQEGHGTFSAGLIRQVAPDAQVLAVPIIADDGKVYGDHVINALGWLADSGGVAAGDVVCLPVCFEPVFPTALPYLEWLGETLGELAVAGVTVVAAAGNDGVDRRAYPAAFAESDVVPGIVPLVSVGAYNTDGKTKAYFSNHGSWVTQWEVGTSVVSTFPQVNAMASAEFAADDRGSADSDDFTGGFARWSGTSFAAAIHAAKLAQKRVGPALDAPPSTAIA